MSKQFQTNEFSRSTQFSSIWPMDRTLPGATTPGRVDLGSMAMKDYSTFPKTPALLDSHHQIVACYIQDTCCWEGVPIWRGAVGVFDSPYQLSHSLSGTGSSPSEKMQAMNSTATVD